MKLRKIFGKGFGTVLGIVIGSLGGPVGASIGASLGSGVDAVAANENARRARQSAEQAAEAVRSQQQQQLEAKRKIVRDNVTAARVQLNQDTATFQQTRTNKQAEITAAEQKIASDAESVRAQIRLDETTLAEAKLKWDALITDHQDKLNVQIQLMLEIAQHCVKPNYTLLNAALMKLDTDLLELIAAELLTICSVDDRDIVQLILIHKLESHLRAQYTPLFVQRAFEGNDQFIEDALEVGVDIETKPIDGSLKGYTALLAACFTSQTSTVKILLDHQANVEARNDQEQAILWVTAYSCGLDKGNKSVEIIKELFMRYPREMREQLKGNYQGNPLHAAASSHHNQEVAKYLINLGTDRSFKDINGLAPEQVAVNRAKAIQELSELDSSISYKQNLLDMVSHHKELARVLGSHVSTHLVSNTRLVTSTLISDMESALNAGADIDSKDSSGCTALLICARAGALDKVKFLHTYNADINAKSVLQESILYCAAESGNVELIQFLFDNYADEMRKQLKAKTLTTNETPLHAAVNKGHQEAAILLIKLGSNRLARDHRGLTSEQSGIVAGFVDLTLSLRRTFERLKRGRFKVKPDLADDDLEEKDEKKYNSNHFFSSSGNPSTTSKETKNQDNSSYFFSSSPFQNMMDAAKDSAKANNSNSNAGMSSSPIGFPTS